MTNTREINFNNVKDDINNIIDVLVLNDEHEYLRDVARVALTCDTCISGYMTGLSVLTADDANDSAEEILNGFRKGVSITCPNKDLAEIATGVFSELISDFFGD